MVCSLHSVTTGSRDRANVPLIIIIIIIQAYLSLTVVGALERVGYATFRGEKESVQKSELVVFCETQQ